MIVTNKAEISTTRLRTDAIGIIEAGIRRVLPSSLIRTAVAFDRARGTLSVSGNRFFSRAGRIFVIGGGKATGRMAEELELILGPENIAAGVVNCTGGHYDTRRVETVEAGHPVPDERGAEGTRRMLSLRDTHSVREHDLILCLISGGGSALMPCPPAAVSLSDKQDTTRLLLRSGASISEVNVVRKHLSRTKGGRLGRFFAPATVVSLIISDVIGNDVGSIASGPTAPDTSTFADACSLLENYGLSGRVPRSVLEFLERGRAGKEEETPKTLDNCFNFVIGDNALALEAMAAEARQRGLTPCVVTSQQAGDPGAAAERRAEEIHAGMYDEYGAVIIGGETTPTLPASPGLGGRNQHYAAVTLGAMRGYPRDWAMASVGTDGSDFLPEVAGAVVDRESLAVAAREGIDVESYVRRYDTHSLFKRLGQSLIVTGNTGTNVSDILVYVLR
jgi:hydroxypyruvate reductase/glycerate 2-kinase